jgi:hypothetical protein
MAKNKAKKIKEKQIKISQAGIFFLTHFLFPIRGL